MPQLGTNMNSKQVIKGKSSMSGGLYLGSPISATHLWKNLITEKRTSATWVNKLYKGSIFDSFWSVLSSPVG